MRSTLPSNWRLLADRRMGEALAAIDKAAGGQPYQDRSSTGNTVLPVDVERPPTYAELGVDKMQAARWQRLAAVPEEIFRAVIDAHVEQHAPITTTGMLRAAERAVEGRRIVENFTGEYDWHTPPAYIEAARTVMGEIDLDPSASEISQRTVRARAYYTRDHDSLSAVWHGRLWVNPPYAHDLIVRFVAKLCTHVTTREVHHAHPQSDRHAMVSASRGPGASHLLYSRPSEISPTDRGTR
jgi:DNA N-6-adenine-methyltransferase (Dam)